MHGQVPGQPQQPGQPGQFGASPFPTQPPHGPPGPPPPAPPRPKRQPWWVWIAVGVPVVLVLSLFGFAVSLRLQSSTVSGPLTDGQCVGTRFEPASSTDQDNREIPSTTRVNCEDSNAKGKVVKLASGPRSAGLFTTYSNPDCPDGTDGVARVTLKTGDSRYWEACVRNIKAPHPGDPGAGGAMISKGDCVSSGSFGGGGEVPCSGKDWYGKVIARVDSAAGCPASQTLETMELTSFGGGKTPRPILCLGRGGGVIGTGDCIEDPSFAYAGLTKAQCGTDDAVARVVARVKSTSQCPPSATNYLRAKDNEAYRPVMCLQKLRPTALEELDALTG